MANTERYETVIRLNTEQAKGEIEKLTKKIEGLRKKRSLIDPLDVEALQKINKEIKKEEANLTAVEGKYQRIERTIKNMSAAGPKDLRDNIKIINTLLNSGSVERGSTQWKHLTSALKEANTELAKIRTETKASQPMLGRFFKFLNDSWGGIFVVLQSISGLTMTIRKSVDDYAKMEEEMADVRKYTGLADEQVRALNESLKRMDTRTSREELNQLAGAAGRLGISSKDSILEFVDAADKIKVALGDDLGEGAVDQIGKLAMAFGEDERMGLRGAMLATGSAVNELAQNSSAKAGFLVDYTARVAGFGKQLGLTQAQIMGYGAVMDENLLRDEMAATAFGNMLTKMQLDTEKFARIAGKDVQEFARLVKEDANQAVLTLADSLQKQDPEVMMQMLNDMGLDGSRAVAVIATLADKIDDVREHQKRATEAYEEGTSVIKEFDTMNNTVQARIDKVKKSFREMSIELGEKLLPIVQYTISGAGLLTKGLSALIGLTSEYSATIISLTGSITVLVAIKEKDIILDKMKVMWNEKVVASVKKLWGLVSKHPYALLAVAITTVIGLLIDLRKKTDAVTEAIDDANKSVNEEIGKLRVLERTLVSANASEEDRRKALQEINGKLMDAHLGNITEEEVRLGRAKGKLDEYVKALRDKITLQRLEASLSQAVTDEMDASDAIDETSFWKNLSGQNYRNFNKRNEARKRQKEISKKIDEYNKRREPAQGNMLDEVVVTYNPRRSGGYSPTGGNSGGGKGGSGSKTDPYDVDMKELEAAYKNRQLLTKKHLADGLLTERQFQDESFNTEMEHLTAKLELQKKYGKETADTEIQMLDLTMQQVKDARQRSAQVLQEELKTAEESYNSDLLELARQRAEGVIGTDREYQERVKETERDYLQQRLAIVRKYGGDTIQEEKAVLDKQVQDVEEFRKQMAKAYEKAYSQADTLDDQRTFAQMMYDQQLIDFEEYQQRMTEIEEVETQKRKDVRQQFFEMGQQLLSAASSYAQACSDLETAKITADYERQIDAAGNNTRKREKLERERDKKLRKLKSESNERAMKIEIAQATATTAANALGAFGAVLQPQMPWTVPLAYAAAAAATVNGLLQIATIKKQHQAEAEGYYEGGFTGGRQYRKEAGVVHEGEFVANHQAVQNPAILPFLNFLDQAQRNNTVGSLTADDVSRSMAGGNAQVVAPIVNVTTDNSELRDTLDETRTAFDRLSSQLDEGIPAYMDTEKAYKALKHFEQLIKNR